MKGIIIAALLFGALNAETITCHREGTDIICETDDISEEIERRKDRHEAERFREDMRSAAESAQWSTEAAAYRAEIRQYDSE